MAKFNVSEREAKEQGIKRVRLSGGGKKDTFSSDNIGSTIKGGASLRESINKNLGIEGLRETALGASKTLGDFDTATGELQNVIQNRPVSIQTIRGGQAQASRVRGQERGSLAEASRQQQEALRFAQQEAQSQFTVQNADRVAKRNLILQFPGAGIAPNDSPQQAAAKIADFNRQQQQTDFQQKVALKNAGSAGGGRGGTLAERIGGVAAGIQENLRGATGADGKVSPDTYFDAKTKFIQAGGTGSQFDNQFASSFLSPESQQQLGISTVSTRAIGKQEKMGAEERKAALNANNALGAIQTLEKVGNLYDKDGTLNRSALATAFVTGNRVGPVGVAKSEMIDVIARLRTGAALTADEESFYNKQAPQFYDSEEVVEQKLNQMKVLFSGFAGNDIVIQNPDGSKFIASDMSGDAQTRQQVRDAITKGAQIIKF